MSSNLDLSGIGGFATEEEAYKVLLREAVKLKRLGRTIWRETQSIKPKEYVRTRNAERALVVKKRKLRDGVNGIMIELTWENDLVWHDSWLYQKGKIKNNQKGHAVMLMSAGWHAKKLEKVYKKRVYRHTYFEGNSYLTKLMKAYSLIKDPRISLEFEISDKIQSQNRKIK